MDRTIGKSENRNNDGERLMISLLEIAQSINEVDDDKIIKYKDKDGESQEMTAGAAKKMDKDHPAKQAWDKMSAQEKGGDDSEKDDGGKLSDTDFDRDGSEDDNDKSDDVEISDANSGPIDREDIMDMLKNDPEIMDKIGTGDDDDLYWDGLDLVSSKMDDQTVASIDGDSNMTLGDLKKQIMDFEYEEEDDPEKVSQFYDETITINGKTYKPIKEGKKKSNPRVLKEIYDRTFRSLK
jgi:hypothetical protein